MYSMSLSPQLEEKTIAGCRPAVVGATTFPFSTTPSPGMSTKRMPVTALALLAAAGLATAVRTVAVRTDSRRVGSVNRRRAMGTPLTFGHGMGWGLGSAGAARVAAAYRSVTRK